GNVATGAGMQISGAGSVKLERMVFTGNTVGGGIVLGGFATLQVKDSTISGNSSTGSGGGIYFTNGGSLLLEGSTISGNTSTVTTVGAGGGGLALGSGARINLPPGSVFTPGTWIIRNSTIDSNTASGSGGGVLVTNSFGA